MNIKKIINISIWLLLYFFCTNLYAANKFDFVITGVKPDVLDNIQARLAIVKKSHDVPLSENSIRSIYQQSIVEIPKAMQPFGYFKPIIHSSLEHNKEDWIAKFAVDPGPELKISYLDVKLLGPGKNDTELQQFVQNFPLKVGDTFKTAEYEKAKETLFTIGQYQGYIKSFLQENKIFISLKAYQAKIIIHFNTGPRYYFGQVTFSETSYSPKFLHKFSIIKPNEPFSAKKLTKVQQQLSNCYYFQDVQIIPDFQNAQNHQVPVKISVVPPKAQHYNLGIGYGSLTGPRIIAGANFRHLTNTGQHLDTQLKLSSVISGLSAKYYIPGKDPLTEQWFVSLNTQRFNPVSGNSTSATLTSGYLKKLENLQISLDANYLIEKFKIENDSTKTHKLLYPNLNVFYMKSDDLINPTNGRSVNMILRGAAQQFASSTSFLQMQIKGKYLFSPTDFARIILRGDFGYTIVHDLDSLPLSMHFFAGGMGSIRGYKDSSIGPGRYLETGSVEYQHHIYENWSAALFYDVGTASDHFGTGFSQSDGVGVIYNSLIGPIKLYAAHALNRPSKPYSIEFSIGPEF